VSDEKQTALDFIETWRQAEQGKEIEPACRWHFESLETLFRVLTPDRWSILKQLRKTGPGSIRALSKVLGRDCKNVHADVRQLITVGLIKKTDDGRIEVPWDIVEAKLNLAA